MSAHCCIKLDLFINIEKTVKILHITYNTCHILEIKKFTCKHWILIHINICCKVHVVIKWRKIELWKIKVAVWIYKIFIIFKYLKYDISINNKTMTIKNYKFKIFKVYYSYKIHLSYKMNGSVRILSGLLWIVSLPGEDSSHRWADYRRP